MNDDYFFRVDPYRHSAECRDLYNLAHDYGLLEHAFYGGVRNYADWLRIMTDAYLYAVIEYGKVVGFTWINNTSGLAGYCHVCLFPTADKKVELGKNYMEFVFSTSVFHTLVGLVPEKYIHAAKYATAIGMKFQCVIEDAIEINGEVQDFHLFKIRAEDI